MVREEQAESTRAEEAWEEVAEVFPDRHQGKLPRNVLWHGPRLTLPHHFDGDSRVSHRDGYREDDEVGLK